LTRAVGGRGLGLLALLGTVLLWGSSFTAIKVTVSVISPLTYVWLRALIAFLGLTPYVLYVGRHSSIAAWVKGGLVTGVVFALGLLFQGWGTRYTSASNSAFITGLNVVFVHLYVGMVRREYSVGHGLGLLLSVAGLYLLTSPEGGLGLGDLLVLVSAVAWAAQVLLVDKFSSSNPVVFTWAEMIPSILLFIPDAALNGVPRVPLTLIPVITYLGLACADAAFTLQVFGQRLVDPASAALIFLLEPVIAAVIAAAVLGESVTPAKAVGMALILVAIVASEHEALRRAKHGGQDTTAE